MTTTMNELIAPSAREIIRSQRIGVLGLASAKPDAFRHFTLPFTQPNGETKYLEERVRPEDKFEDIIGRSASLRAVLDQVKIVAPTNSTVLILGETGTGKELIARAIHNRSSRRDRPFIRVNCAAIPSGLLES